MTRFFNSVIYILYFFFVFLYLWSKTHGLILKSLIVLFNRLLFCMVPFFGGDAAFRTTLKSLWLKRLLLMACRSAVVLLDAAALGRGQPGLDPGWELHSGMLSVSSHPRASGSPGHFLLMADDKGTSSKENHSSIFSASACIKFINSPLTKASHGFAQS